MSELHQVAEKAREREIERREMMDRLEGRLHVTFGGGMWKITPEFISFIDILARAYPDQTIPVVDIYKVPRMIDPKALASLAVSRYQEAINEYHVDYQKVARIR